MSLFDRLFGKPTLEDVAREAVKWLRAAGFEKVDVDLQRGTIAAARGDSPCQIYLGNLLHDYRQAPRRERQSVLQRFLLGVMDSGPPDRYDDVRARLMPVVRNAAYLGVTRLAALRDADASGALRIASKPLVADLVVALVVDSPTSMRYVNEETLEQWGIPFEAALEDALDNLRSLPEHGGWEAPEPGVWSGEWGDAYESSRLLLPDLIYRLGVAKPVAMVPFNGALLVTSADNDDGLRALARVAGQAAPENNRWLSFRLLRLDDRTWKELDAPEHSAASLRELELENQGGAYASQKELLDACTNPATSTSSWPPTGS
jgi:hypothetical protein